MPTPMSLAEEKPVYRQPRFLKAAAITCISLTGLVAFATLLGIFFSNFGSHSTKAVGEDEAKEGSPSVEENKTPVAEGTNNFPTKPLPTEGPSKAKGDSKKSDIPRKAAPNPSTSPPARDKAAPDAPKAASSKPPSASPPSTSPPSAIPPPASPEGLDADKRLDGISKSWADSYSIGGKCYCQTTFDHDTDKLQVRGPGGALMSVPEACAKAGSGPKKIGDEKRKYYNTVNCGNKPYNDQWDEVVCPGRVDLGDGNRSGCLETGPGLDA